QPSHTRTSAHPSYRPRALDALRSAQLDWNAAAHACPARRTSHRRTQSAQGDAALKSTPHQETPQAIVDAQLKYCCPHPSGCWPLSTLDVRWPATARAALVLVVVIVRPPANRT